MRAPFAALWASLAYLVVALTVSSWLCLRSIQVLSGESAKAIGQLEFMNPAWVISNADNAVAHLFWLCVSTGLGILLVGMSVVWLSLDRKPPA